MYITVTIFVSLSQFYTNHKKILPIIIIINRFLTQKLTKMCKFDNHKACKMWSILNHIVDKHKRKAKGL